MSQQPAWTDATAAAARRARFYIPVNHFTEPRPRPAPHAFEDERRAVLAADPGPTRCVPLDLSAQLRLPLAATTATLLASYLVVRAGDTLVVDPQAFSSLAYALRGRGWCEVDGQRIAWQAGDLLALPGDVPAAWHAEDGDALLYAACDAPLCRYLQVRPRLERREPVLYTATALAAKMDELESLDEQEAVGRAVIFTTADQAAHHTVAPLLIANINTLRAGRDQRTHVHNGAALTLSLRGDGCHSMVGDTRVDWQPFGVMVTPAAMPHSHHNRGHGLMVSLVVQDSGLYEHAGTSGFGFRPEVDAQLRAREAAPA